MGRRYRTPRIELDERQEIVEDVLRERPSAVWSSTAIRRRLLEAGRGFSKVQVRFTLKELVELNRVESMSQVHWRLVGS